MMNTTTNDSQKSVEQIWRETFSRHDNIDQDQADLFVNLVFGTPRLSLGDLDATTFRNVVEESLSEVEYEPRLDDGTDPSAVHEKLMNAVDEGLEGERVGPAVAPSSIAEDPDAKSTQGTTEGGPTVASPSPKPNTSAGDLAPQPRKGRAAKVPEDRLEDIADVLENVISEFDIELAELQGALELMRERSEE